ncbi:DUF1206 domain-containing protein [soil metagenome]
MTPTSKQQAKEELAPWVERLSRFGYATKGLVYIVVGVLAFQAAFELGGRTTDSTGALQSIFRQPFGRIMLFAIAIGLTGYLVWRLTEAIFDIEGKGTDFKGIIKRLGYAFSGLAYGSLALTALQLALGLTVGAGGEDGSQVWTARLLNFPFGRYLVGAIGVVAAGLGLNAAYVAVTGMFLKKIKTEEMSDTAEKWVAVAGATGLIARGIVLAIVGWFFLQAAWHIDADKAGDSGKALSIIEGRPFGSWLLGILAVGVIVYGLYALLVQSRYRQMNL